MIERLVPPSLEKGSTMAITFFTQYPEALLMRVRESIKNGHVRTWSVSNIFSVECFTHIPSQFFNEAFLKPSTEKGLVLNSLVMNIFPKRGSVLSHELFGIYQGRFIEMMTNHFSDGFTYCSASATMSGNDSLPVLKVQPSSFEQG